MIIIMENIKIFSNLKFDIDTLSLDKVFVILNQLIQDKDILAILIGPSKIIKNEVNIINDKKNFLLESIFLKHNYFNQTDILTFHLLTQNNLENLFLKSLYSSIRYSLFDIPFGSSSLGFVIPVEEGFNTSYYKESFDSLLKKNINNIMNEKNYLKIDESIDGNIKEIFYRSVENLEKPRFSTRFRYLLYDPFKKKILKEKYEISWLKNILKYFYRKDKARILLHSINTKSIDILKELLKDDFFMVIGIGEKNYAYFDLSGIKFRDIDSIEKRIESKKSIDYVDFLKKDTDVFIETGPEFNFNQTMANILNATIFCELSDFAVPYEAVKTLQKKKVKFLSSLILNALDEILNYFEIIERKREELMSNEEIDLRLETYLKYLLNFFDSSLENDDKTDELILNKFIGNYTKKLNLICG